MDPPLINILLASDLPRDHDDESDSDGPVSSETSILIPPSSGLRRRSSTLLQSLEKELLAKVDYVLPKQTDDDLQPSNKWTVSQKSLIASICFLQFFAFACLSVLAPFFPHEAAKKGVSGTTSGFIFSCYAFTQVIVSPIVGKYFVPFLGPRKVILIGSAFGGCCALMFAVLDEIDDTNTFAAMAFAVRTFEAFGIASYSTAAFTFIINCFPDCVGVVVGITEISVGMGLTLGPALGGAMYAIGGYKLPFFVLGSCLLATVPVNVFVLPSDKEVATSMQTPQLSPMLRHPYTLLCCICVVAMCTATSFNQPTLQPHLAEIGLTPVHAGLLFILSTACYSITGPFVGRFSDARPRLRHLLIAGGLTSAGAAFLLMGPSPIFPFLHNSVALNVISLIIHGVGIGFVFVPSFEITLAAALHCGYEDNIATYSVVSGLYQSVFSLGDTVGPSIGGILLDHVGYPLAASTISVICFTVAAIFLGVHFNGFYPEKAPVTVEVVVTEKNIPYSPLFQEEKDSDYFSSLGSQKDKDLESSDMLPQESKPHTH